MPTLTRPIVPSDVVIAPKIDTFCRLPSSCSHPTQNVGLGPTEQEKSPGFYACSTLRRLPCWHPSYLISATSTTSTSFIPQLFYNGRSKNVQSYASRQYNTRIYLSIYVSISASIYASIYAASDDIFSCTNMHRNTTA